MKELRGQKGKEISDEYKEGRQFLCLYNNFFLSTILNSEKRGHQIPSTKQNTTSLQTINDSQLQPKCTILNIQLINFPSTPRLHYDVQKSPTSKVVLQIFIRVEL